jgi:phosphate-selective porin OprO/OprP
LICLADLADPALAEDEPQSSAIEEKSAGVQAKFGEGLSYTTASRNFKTTLSGWLQADTAMYNEDRTTLSDGTRIRRGRISWSVELLRRWKLRAEYDLASKSQDMRGLQDLYLRYSGIRRTSLTIGNLKEPIGLEWQTSSKNITFMERSLPIALVPPYHLGLAVNTHGGAWSLSGGLFGARLADGVRDHNGWGTSGRFTVSPFHDDTGTLHLGISGGYRAIGDQSPKLRFDSRPEINVENVRFIDTHSMTRVVDYKLLGVEAAWMPGPFSLQAEYLRSFVNRNRGRDDLDFDGWYVMGSWFVTGESRNYDRKSGSFGHVRPKRPFNFEDGWGAWEVAARYSALDLTNQHISGGQETNVTVGINWYPAANVKLMANYVLVRTDGEGLRTKHPVSERPQILALRAQVEF